MDGNLTNDGAHTYTYDAAGNLTGDGTCSYQYDAEGRIKYSNCPWQWQYPMYNALGQRVQDYQSSGSGSVYLLYPRGIAGHRMETFQYNPGVWAGADVWFGRVAGYDRLEMGGSTSWLAHTDVVGTMTMETDQTGAVTWDATHYPWGQQWQANGPRPTGGFYADLEWPVNDPVIPSATREYNPWYYRWLTPDPGGRKVVNLANPQTWNMYAYALNNPITLNDPSGMAAKGCNQEAADVCAKKQTPDGQVKAGRQDQLQRVLQAYFHAQRVKEQQFAQKQAGPAIGSKEYIKQLANKTAALTSSGEKELLLPVAIEQGVVLAVVAAPEAAAAVGPAVETTGRAAFGYAITHPLETNDFVKGVLTGAGIGAISSEANAIGDAINALVKYLQR